MTEKQIGDALLSKHPMMFRNAAGYGIATSPKAIHKLQGGKFLLDHGSPLALWPATWLIRFYWLGDC